jgi:hypothetical protein
VVFAPTCGSVRRIPAFAEGRQSARRGALGDAGDAGCAPLQRILARREEPLMSRWPTVHRPPAYAQRCSRASRQLLFAPRSTTNALMTGSFAVLAFGTLLFT